MFYINTCTQYFQAKQRIPGLLCTRPSQETFSFKQDFGYKFNKKAWMLSSVFVEWVESLKDIMKEKVNNSTGACNPMCINISSFL